MMDPEYFAEQVFERRKRLGLSQGRLAQAAEISRNYVSLIERGEALNVSMNVINQLAAALGTTAAELTGEKRTEAFLIPPALRTFGLQAGLRFDIVDRLARIPRRGHEPRTPEEWQQLYEAVRLYLEE